LLSFYLVIGAGSQGKSRRRAILKKNPGTQRPC
jgi:hypothetical protein